MRAAAEVHKIPRGINGNFAVRQFFQKFQLIGFAAFFKKFFRFGFAHGLAFKGNTGLDELFHFGLNGFQVFGRESVGTVKIVIKAVFHGGADAQLGAGEQLLHGRCHYMRARMAFGFQFFVFHKYPSAEGPLKFI